MCWNVEARRARIGIVDQGQRCAFKLYGRVTDLKTAVEPEKGRPSSLEVAIFGFHESISARYSRCRCLSVALRMEGMGRIRLFGRAKRLKSGDEAQFRPVSPGFNAAMAACGAQPKVLLQLLRR